MLWSRSIKKQKMKKLKLSTRMSKYLLLKYFFHHWYWYSLLQPRVQIQLQTVVLILDPSIVKFKKGTSSGCTLHYGCVTLQLSNLLDKFRLFRLFNLEPQNTDSRWDTSGLICWKWAAGPPDRYCDPFFSQQFQQTHRFKQPRRKKRCRRCASLQIWSVSTFLHCVRASLSSGCIENYVI